ncbi:hypothetical protein G7048_09375 [Diaphorobacter sp. HDW4B]|uniref:hypothetical protein n=1 Tax=Diaphorobacter sp. HDW4B TaxID=2714925 RepID=UPI00140E0669|nr:hypothetical protein [Diaphorobacter sp. HDW4B]QIL70546.1 hypothetical protein G7048_09375 [Diaphorobacter sp. HDW4B]
MGNASNSITLQNSGLLGIGNVDAKTADIDVIMTMLESQTRRTQHLDVAVSAQMREMKLNNAKTASTNALLSELRGLNNCVRKHDKGKDGGMDDKYKTDGKVIPPKDPTANSFKEKIRVLCSELNIKFTDKNPGELEVMIQNVKSTLDGLSNDQQMHMTRLQNLMSKRNECFDTMTNTLRKIQEQKDRMIAHIS